MNLRHVVAVFKAEYYTTTSKFRKYRKIIPLIFVLGIVFFGYILRLLFNFVQGTQNLNDPPTEILFAIIAIFSYFTLFAPTLSPFGRVVYDGGARSRRSVALNSPVESKALLYGNLLSNLAFFLPLFTLIGTLSLVPFLGNGNYSNELTSIMLFAVLSLLVTIGLVGGTLLSPVIFNYISSKRSAHGKAIVTFGFSLIILLSLPLLQFFLKLRTKNTGFSLIYLLPFTLSAIIIIFILYGQVIVFSPLFALFGMLFYLVAILLLGNIIADNIYHNDNDEIKPTEVNPNSHTHNAINNMMVVVPRSLRSTTSSMIKASIRDIEHISRLTLGVTISIFMIYALSSRGLFQNTDRLPNIELSIVILALVLSVSSVIFIEASAFTVQHREVFTLIKASPYGPRKFVLSKAIQMLLIIFPVYTVLILLLSVFGLIVPTTIPLLLVILFLILISLSSFSLFLYLINPSDNEEDITNLINLMIFYTTAMVIGLFPFSIIISGNTFTLLHLLIAVLVAILIFWISIKYGTIALDTLDLETMESPLSVTAKRIFKAFVIFILIWNIYPIIFVPFLLNVESLIDLLLINYLLLSGTLLTIYIIFNRFRTGYDINITGSIKLTGIILIIMGILAFSISQLSFLFDVPDNMLITQLIGNFEFEIVLVILALVVIAEEIMFRGIIYSYLRDKLGEIPSSIVSSLYFALIHIFSIISILNAFIQGLFLCYLKEKTKSVVFPILAHLIYNIALITIIIL